MGKGVPVQVAVLQESMSGSDSPTKAVAPGLSPEWRESVETDLRKACDALTKAHEAEAEATVAVLLSEVEYDASVTNSANVSKMLRESHTTAMKAVNDSERHLRELLEGEVQLGPIYTSSMNNYTAILKQRSGTLYTCHTHTLAARHLVSTRARKLAACKQHLVNMVSDRTAAEDEVERISGIYADQLKYSEDLLQEQLAFVRSGGVDKRLTHTNTDLSFVTDFKEHCKLFQTTGSNDDRPISPPPADPVPHEEHDAQVDQTPKAATNDFTHDVYA